MSNFAPIDDSFPKLAKLGRKAEAAFSDDPQATMAHLRVWGEKLALDLLDKHRQPVYAQDQFSRIRRLQHHTSTPVETLDDLHVLRKEGNKAVHADGTPTPHKDGMKMLRAAARLVAWYWRTWTQKRPPPPGTFKKPVAKDERGEAAILRAQLAVAQAGFEKTSLQLDELLRLLNMPQVATYSGVEVAWRALPEEQQEAASVFLKLFREEPLSDDWPLATPEGMSDDKVRLATYEGLVLVVIQPDRGDLLLVAHLDTSEEASLDWARNRRFEVHPTLGTLQVYDVVEANQASPGTGGLFDAHGDALLMALGVPTPLLPAVRRLDSEDALDALAEHLPPEAADGLYLLAAGYSSEDALAELAQPVAEDSPEVDPQDFSLAVHHPQSQRSFLLLEEDTDLEAVLSGSLEAWRVYLHPDQRKLVQMNARGPVRVLGGAGTGKTVALLHRAAHLVRNVFVGDERVLVTTYTRNLAADLGVHLDRLLEPAERARVEVSHIHGLTSDLWKQHGDGRKTAWSGPLKAAWDRAMTAEELGHAQSFYQEEWELIVQGQALTDELGYLRARRVGRGVPLNRNHRRSVWQVFQAYRAELDEQGLMESADVLRELAAAFTAGSAKGPWSAALVDECQDLGPPELRFLRALIPEGPGDLFLVGDGHQRIFGRPVRFGACGIEIRGRSRRLKVNYRTTARVRNWAVRALEGESFDDLDGGQDNLKGYRSLRLGLSPREVLCEDRGAERASVLGTVRDWLESGPAEHICVAAPSNKQVEELANLLEDVDIPVYVLDTDAVDARPGVRLATFHRMKGLEFPRVLLTHVEEGQMPLRISSFHRLDEDAKRLWDLRQRCLLYVAATRARDELVVTGVGRPSPFL